MDRDERPQQRSDFGKKKHFSTASRNFVQRCASIDVDEVPETAKTVRSSIHEAEIDTDRTAVFNHGLCTNLQAKEVRSWYGSQIYLDCDTGQADKGVLDGVFYAELSEFFTRELSSEGYSGCEVRAAHARTEIIIRATHTQEVLGEKGRRIRELTALVQKRFKFGEGAVELYAEKVRKADRSIGIVFNVMVASPHRSRTVVYLLSLSANPSDTSF